VSPGVVDPIHPGRTTTLDATLANPQAFGLWDAGLAPDMAVTPGVRGAIGASSNAPLVWAGAKAQAFVDDFYERVHVVPNRIDLGNLINPQTRNIEVWNAFIGSSKTLTQILTTNASGTTLTPPTGGTPPATFASLQSRIYTLSVALDGPPNVNALYTFDFSPSGTPALTVVGSRISLFAWSAQKPLVERVAWMTDILEARGGLEQRIAVREAPRQSFTARYLAQGLSQATMEALLFEWLGRVFAVPAWEDRRYLVADAAIGATVLKVDETTYADFRAGGLVSLWHAYDDFEMAEIQSIGTGTLTLARPLEKAHAAGVTVVVPARLAQARDGVEQKRHPSNVVETVVQWQAAEFKDFAVDDATLTADGVQFYRSAPVLMEPNILNGEIDQRVIKKVRTIDADTGIFRVVLPRAVPELGSVRGWAVESPAAWARLRRFIHSMRGRQRAFWAPTWQYDITLQVAATNGSTSLQIENIGYTRFVQQRVPRADIMIRLKTGTTLFRRIDTSAEAPDGSYETLTIDSAVPQTIDPTDVDRISFLEMVRFNADEIEFTHLGQARVEVVVPVAGVRQ